MRIDTLFWLVTYVLLGSAVLYGVARVALWLRQRRQAQQLEAWGDALTREGESAKGEPREGEPPR